MRPFEKLISRTQHQSVKYSFMDYYKNNPCYLEGTRVPHLESGTQRHRGSHTTMAAKKINVITK